MSKFNYQVVSMAVILRDFTDVVYINDEHRMLVDIADSLYNADLSPEHLKPEYKALYDEYGKEFWESVIADATAIDSQVDGHVDDLARDYLDYINQSLSPTRPKQRCPKCHEEFTERPAISREDNKTEICPACGLREAMQAFMKEKGIEADA